MKKFLVRTTIVLAVLAIALLAALGIMAEVRRADPAPEALAALEPGGGVDVSSDTWLTFRPAEGRPATGMILYPGASCDVRGYAPLLRRFAAEGFLVVAVPMPFDFSIFAPERALAVIDAHPEIEHWLLAGHSMGGAMAGLFVSRHPQAVDGLMFWDSYPPGSADLSGSPVPVWHIHRATPGGEAPENFSSRRGLFPADSEWTAIPGGNHMNFGSFVGGAYVEQWEATISREDQQAQIVEATLRALRTLDRGGAAPAAIQHQRQGQ